MPKVRIDNKVFNGWIVTASYEDENGTRSGTFNVLLNEDADDNDIAEAIGELFKPVE